MIFDENLAAVHAYLCADGYVIRNPINQRKKYYRIGLRNTNLDLLEDFQKKFYAYFKEKPHISPGQRCQLGSKKIYLELTSNFGSFYSWKWSMPNLDKQLYSIWLRSYFDCEGWVTLKSRSNRMIGLECVNRSGILQIKMALRYLGIASKIKKRNTRNIYSLSIYGQENLNLFKQKIGFFHPEKIIKLDKALEDYVDYTWKFPLGIYEKTNFIRDLMKNKATMKRPNGIFRVISNTELNILKLQEGLKEIFDIKGICNKRKNGKGNEYFELSINKKDDVFKLINQDLLREEFKTEWLKLKK